MADVCSVMDLFASYWSVSPEIGFTGRGSSHVYVIYMYFVLSLLLIEFYICIF